jgi:hypothetical protein
VKLTKQTHQLEYHQPLLLLLLLLLLSLLLLLHCALKLKAHVARCRKQTVC